MTQLTHLLQNLAGNAAVAGLCDPQSQAARVPGRCLLRRTGSVVNSPPTNFFGPESSTAVTELTARNITGDRA